MIDKSIILYGAGSLGKMAHDFFNHLHIPFLYTVDIYADKYSKNQTWKHTKVIHPDLVPDYDKKNSLLIVCIVTTPLSPLKEKLLKEGWEDVEFFYNVSQAYNKIYPLNNGWVWEGQLTKKDKENIRKVFSFLEDTNSKEHYAQFLAWRISKRELSLKNFTVNNTHRFFIPEITNILHNQEIFIDGGAHTGDVSRKFAEITQYSYSHIYAIEPDPQNFKALSKSISKLPRVTLFSCAFSNRNSRQRFFSGFNFSSQLHKKGNILVPTKKIDVLNLAPTFIKLHLEGAEFNTLKGAIKTILKYRPILAITIYHNADGIWKIPLLLMQTLKDYTYYIRMHTWAGTGAVLYAVPRERIKK